MTLEAVMIAQVATMPEELQIDSMIMGDYEYLFFRLQSGQPKGQIKVLRQYKDGPTLRKERVVVSETMPEEVKQKFLKYAGVKTVHELLWGPDGPPQGLR